MYLFSSALKKYYRKEGNKILFHGEMTLNTLAMRMWERLDFSNMDASILSKVINGKRLFSNQQFNIFCDILQLPDTERDDLRLHLIYDINARNGIEIDSYFIRRKELEAVMNRKLSAAE